MYIEFSKMHGCGNDFVVIDNTAGRIKLSKSQIMFLCGRHKGIGADGVILIESSDKADCFMNYYNSDGGEAEMCGNGIRCVALFLTSFLKIKKDLLKIETRSGVKEIKRQDNGIFSVNMGKPSFESSDFPKNSLNILDTELSFVSMGNPHAIAFIDNVAEFDLKSIGPVIEKNENFPNKINFEIVEKVKDDKFKVRVWERGCGETQACGTGACAVFALLDKNNLLTKKEIVVALPGGELVLSKNDKEEIIMSGEALNVFSSMIEL